MRHIKTGTGVTAAYAESGIEGTMVKKISILGCTGSIGRQTAAVAEYTGIPVAALTANRQIDRLEEQARKFQPELVAV